MPPDIEIEPLGYTPRALALLYQTGDSFIYMSPMRDILGGMLARSPAVIGNRLRSTQNYRNWLRKEGSRSYNPLFIWDDAMLSEPDIAGAVREAVKKSEGAYTLYDAYPNKAVRKLKAKGPVLDAEVKAKSRPGHVIPAYHIVNLTSPYLSEKGEMQLTSLTCSCPDHVIDSEKRSSKAIMRCMHVAAMHQEFAGRFKYPSEDRPLSIKGEPAGKAVFLPFTFTYNFEPDEEGCFGPKNKHLAALEYDAIIAYYLRGGDDDTQFGIDRRLYRIMAIYSDALKNAIKEGEIRREVVGQRPENSDRPHSELRAEGYVFKQVARRLRDNGYQPEGRCLEFGSRVALRYEKGNGNAVNVVAGGDGPMFLVVRRAVGRATMPEGAYHGPSNPARILGTNLISYDDRTMQDTFTRIEMPSAMRLPETGKKHIPINVPDVLRAKWRKAVQEGSARGSVTANLKYTRLNYCR